MTDVIIRAARERDLAQIVALWQMLQEINASYEPRLALNTAAVDWFTAYLKDQLDNSSAAVLVAFAEGEMVGYTFGQILRRPTLLEGDCGYVADLCVRADHQGHGIGRRLYEFLRAWFMQRDIHAIEVQVVRANPASQTFWRKMGFMDFLRTLRADL